MSTKVYSKSVISPLERSLSDIERLLVILVDSSLDSGAPKEFVLPLLSALDGVRNSLCVYYSSK